MLFSIFHVSFLSYFILCSNKPKLSKLIIQHLLEFVCCIYLYIFHRYSVCIYLKMSFKGLVSFSMYKAQ